MKVDALRFRRSKLTVFACVACACVCSAGDNGAVHVRNFGQVNAHIYRGGEPTAEGLRELAAIKISTDIDLREAGSATENERRIAESLGMHYVNVPMNGFSAPSHAEVVRVLTLIVPDDAGKTFVHCRRGKDRTGTIIACYRIEHDGWDRHRAQEEANRYGMSWTERGMRSFVMAFKPIDLPPPLQGPK